jgi:hypothetical protein
MTSYYVFETLTGKILTEFEPEQASWSMRANEAETVSVTLDLSDPANRALDWRNLATPWKHCIAIEEHGRFLGGPILPHDWDEDDHRLKLSVRGIRVLLGRRTVLPARALTASLVTPAGIPDTSLDTTISGVDLGTVGKRLIQQAMSWPGFELPIVFHEDRPGSITRSYAAVDLSKVDAALADLSDEENGPDIRLQLRRGDKRDLEWVYESGTAAEPRLQSPSVHTWELQADEAAGSGVSVTTDPTEMASISWATAGRSSDRVLVSRYFDRRLVDAGFPLMEAVDSSNSSVSEQTVLDGLAAERARTSLKPSEFWSFRVRLDASPFLIEYNVGDLVRVVVRNSDYVPVGEFTRRIAGLSGDEQGDWIKVTCGEVYDG